MVTPPPRAVERRPELPVAVDDVLAIALAKAPAERYESAGAFVHELCLALGVPERGPSSLVRTVISEVAVAPPAPELELPRALLSAGDAPLVGRDAQLDALTAAWTQVSEGACTLAAVRGEAGIGKTRLAAELARVARAGGAGVLYGRCDDVLAVPYQPFVEALRPLVIALGVERVRRETGELRRLWPDLEALGEPLHADPETERFALFEAVAALVKAATRTGPLLLVLDDLHWAAAPTVLLLRHLMRSEQQRLLVVATFRDTDVTSESPLSSMLPDLYRANATPVSVKGIDDAAIAALAPEASPELVRALREQTGGNPFFLRELLRDGGELGTSERLRQVIGQRVGRLSEPARQLLDAAAVAGATWSFAVLDRALGGRDELLDALEEALRAGLILEAGGDDYTFTHALVRQTLYDGLGRARAARLHRSVGEALLELDPDAHIEELAHHFALCGSERAAAYALLAGRRAVERLGYEQAVEHYERGLAARPDDDERTELLLALAEARWATGDVPGVRAAASEAAALGNPEQLARAALVYGGPLFFSATGEVLNLIERALAALPEADGALRAQLLARLASSSNAEARRTAMAGEALAMAHRAGDPHALADVLVVTRLALRGPDDIADRTAAAHELAAVADEIADGRLRGFAHEWRLNLALELADIQTADLETDALARLFAARGDRHLRWLTNLLDARRALLEGRLDDAERLALKALQSAGANPGQFSEGPTQAFSAQMIYVRLEQGRLIELLPQIEGFVRDFGWVSGWRSALAYVYALLGRGDDSRVQFETLATEGFLDFPRDALWLLGMAHLSEVAAELDDSARAAQLYALLEPYGGRVIVALGACCLGSVARSLGRLATTMGHHDAAAAHLEQAIAVNTAIRSPVWTAHAQLDMAELALRRGEPAAAWIEPALATADRLGLTQVQARAARM